MIPDAFRLRHQYLDLNSRASSFNAVKPVLGNIRIQPGRLRIDRPTGLPHWHALEAYGVPLDGAGENEG